MFAKYPSYLAYGIHNSLTSKQFMTTRITGAVLLHVAI